MCTGWYSALNCLQEQGEAFVEQSLKWHSLNVDTGTIKVQLAISLPGEIANTMTRTRQMLGNPFLESYANK